LYDPGAAESKPSEPELGNTSEGKTGNWYCLEPFSSDAPYLENGFIVFWRLP
jgi:hypothetical protein